MLDILSRCTRVWTIVPHIREHVKNSILPRYTWVIDFISFESFFKVFFIKKKIRLNRF
jgi:hypothetical protein